MELSPNIIQSDPKPKKKRRIPNKHITYKQKLFAQAYVNNHGNATQAYLEASPAVTLSTANVEGHRTLNKPIVKEAIFELMQRQGFTEEMLVGKLSKLVEADKALVVSADDVRQVPDHQIRLGAVQTGLKLHGHLSGSDGAVIHGGINIGVHSKADLDRLSDIASMLERTAQSLGIHRAGAQDGEVIDVEPIEPKPNDAL